MNSFVLVGRVDKIEQEEKRVILTIKISRPYKNVDGKYDEDLVKVNVLKNLSSTLERYCNINDIIGVKGRIQTDNILLAEKITFLSNSNKK